MAQIQVTVLENRTKVKIKHPGPGERGTWRVLDLVKNSGWDNPAYEIENEKSGRRRIIRKDRLTVLRRTT
jgi:hypothetical protein